MTGQRSTGPIFARYAARREGYQRAKTDWRAIAEADDIDEVSVALANHLHREIVEARAMVAGTENSGLVATSGCSTFNGHHWCDYGHDPDAPIS